jgi:hypothetical protein
MPTNERGPNARLPLGPEHCGAQQQAGYRDAVRPSTPIVQRSLKIRGSLYIEFDPLFGGGENVCMQPDCSTYRQCWLGVDSQDVSARTTIRSVRPSRSASPREISHTFRSRSQRPPTSLTRSLRSSSSYPMRRCTGSCGFAAFGRGRWGRLGATKPVSTTSSTVVTRKSVSASYR